MTSVRSIRDITFKIAKKKKKKKFTSPVVWFYHNLVHKLFIATFDPLTLD